jgi:hypothetical protein
VIVAIVAVVVIVGIAAIMILPGSGGTQVAALASSPSSSQYTEQAIPIQGRDHIQRGTPHDPYNSNPPTSGPHYADKTNMLQVQAGFYDESNAPLDEDLIHSEEHGYVIIWYNCAKAPNVSCDALKQGIKELRDQLGDTKLIALPRANLDTMLAMTSWGKLQKFDAFDTDQMSSFYHRNFEQSPEPDGY